MAWKPMKMRRKNKPAHSREIRDVYRVPDIQALRPLLEGFSRYKVTFVGENAEKDKYICTACGRQGMHALIVEHSAGCSYIAYQRAWEKLAMILNGA